ncbi:hypothetical protein J2W25_001608 [Variovorax boronicumulans]|uniref:Uncharacterized protein n=1 Tax=Variovorax boronicumulans TaxID=436515 RepID=A0AAW8DTF4_9BURK|nr:hypothetical protein [Variovorax boronicumulans]MDP9922587.1 hypothetical protein [Variovorax boronicumulans]
MLEVADMGRPTEANLLHVTPRMYTRQCVY